MKRKIIIASSSPRRKQLAQQMGLEFEITPSSYEENMQQKLTPKKLAQTLAHGKALDVASKTKNGVVIGVDTLVSFEGKVIGKPKTKLEAFKMLKQFSGKKQEVYSGIALIDCDNKKTIIDYELTQLKFRKINDIEIKKYINAENTLDKAGAYAIQGLAAIFIEKINGDYHNIMGFPIYRIYKNLEKLGIDIFEYDAWGEKK